MAKHTKKWILEHYECDGQMSIDDLYYPCDTCLFFDWRTKECRKHGERADLEKYAEVCGNGQN